MSIPPCTTGPHSAVDDTPAPDPAPKHNGASGAAKRVDPSLPAPQARLPTRQVQTPTATASATPKTAPPPEDEDDSDDSASPIPTNATCKRRGCGATYTDGQRNGNEGKEETCTHHPGHPIFHEGSKGWTCCKRRVLEFDEFLRIEGCKSRARHCFVGKRKGKRGGAGDGEDREEVVEHVRCVVRFVHILRSGSSGSEGTSLEGSIRQKLDTTNHPLADTTSTKHPRPSSPPSS